MRGATATPPQTPPLSSDFNPRAPCGARRVRRHCPIFGTAFQSTRPMRGATLFAPVNGGKRKRFQSTRPMRGATPDPVLSLCRFLTYFNPRAPCGARRARPPLAAPGRRNFNPRAPCGARRGRAQGPPPLERISIHAPHAGRDLFAPVNGGKRKRFQSTRPMRGATFQFRLCSFVC